ncbi:MAG: glycosyltransferase family 4 protein [Fibrobacter sp.]|nr:glycosyltransferase family 4 protein [Fibrobacter sp.]
MEQKSPKKILLISNRVMHYRSRIYNKFFDLFAKLGYEFHVASNDYQKVDFPIRYIKHERAFSTSGYIKIIKEINPDVCINFLHLKDKIIIPLTFYCRFKGIPMIYWNHGINIKTPDAKLKNSIFHFIHTISNAIILYSPAQLKYLSKKNQKKTYIAKNTLDFSDVNKSTLRSPKEVKAAYGIKEKRVLLYISRILPYKGLDILLNNFKGNEDIALVIVGGGINEQQQATIDSTPNYYYLGEKYGSEVDEIYQMGDVFSTPGHIGLALNQAMYWGKPVVVLNRIHAPEIVYLKNGENGFIANTEEELKTKILNLCTNENALAKASQAARKTYEDEMQIGNMFQGFVDAIHFVGK